MDQHSAPKKKRQKRSGGATVTTLTNVASHAGDVAKSNTHKKMTFRCPASLQNVFCAPSAEQVKVFYESRQRGLGFEHLPKAEKARWTEACHDNNTLMGFIIYAMLFPKLLQTRIKLNAATYHWAHLDPASEKGRAKLEQRRSAVDRLNRRDFTRSVFSGLPYKIDIQATNILQFANLQIEEEDERFRFLTGREFSMICSERGEVSSSSVYASCSTALSLLWFATTVLARPCCLESVVLPLTVTERQMMEQRFGCQSQFFDGPIKKFSTDWKQIFAAIGTHQDRKSVV